MEMLICKVIRSDFDVFGNAFWTVKNVDVSTGKEKTNYLQNRRRLYNKAENTVYKREGSDYRWSRKNLTYLSKQKKFQ